MTFKGRNQAILGVSRRKLAAILAETIQTKNEEHVRRPIQR